MSADKFTPGQRVEVLNSVSQQWFPGVIVAVLDDDLVEVSIKYTNNTVKGIRSLSEIRVPAEGSQ